MERFPVRNQESLLQVGSAAFGALNELSEQINFRV